MLKRFFVCYYVVVGVSVPFFPPYLRNLGLSGREVSLMMSVAPFMHLGVPLCWGWLADRTRRPDLLLRFALLGALLCFAPLVFVRSMPAMLYVFAAHQLFAVPIVGLADTLTLEQARRTGEDYSRIRLWGSASFVAACFAAGPLLAWRGRRDGDPAVPLLMTLGLVAALLSSLAVTGQGGRERPHAQDLRLLLRDRRFLFLLMVAPLHWACAAPYHGFLSILIQDRGLPPTTMSHAFTLSVLGELAAFYFFRSLRRRFTLATLLSLAFAATAVRWALVSVSTSAAALVALQILHMLTFGVFWGSAVGWLAEVVPPRLRATGQTLYTAATFGVGNLIGIMGSGFLYDRTKGAATSFAVAAAVELLPLTLALTMGRRLVTKTQAEQSAPA